MSFAGIPPLPTTGITEAELMLFSAFKQNMEELTGQSSAEFAAVLRGNITVLPVGVLQAGLPNVVGKAYSISGTGTVPDYTDFVEVVKTVQKLVADTQAIRNKLDVLINQLGG